MTNSAPRILDLTSVQRVVHGIGAMEGLPALLDERRASKVVVASCKSVIEKSPLIDDLKGLLGSRFVGLGAAIGSHTPVADVEALCELALRTDADAIVAIGGSSVSDAAKIASLRVSGVQPQITVHDGVITAGDGAAPKREKPTLIVIPTTLSAGEFNGGSGMTDGESGAKIMVMDDRQLPWAIILDPLATLSTPYHLWASTGIKAVDHAAEAIWGARSHIYGDALSSAALRSIISGLERTKENFEDLEARLECQIGSWLSVASMKNTQLHLSHIVEHNMGATWHLAHGITSCIALPTIMAFLAAETPDKVGKVARAFGVPEVAGQSELDYGVEGAQWLSRWIANLGLPTRLRDVLGDKSGFEAVAAHSVNELSFFGYIPEGREATIVRLLEQMW